MLTLFFWLFSQWISAASLAITQTKWNNLFKYWWKSTAFCPPAVRSGARWVTQITPITKDTESHFGLWEQLVSLGITPFHARPYHTRCLAVTQEPVVNFSFILGNINFACATAEGTPHRSGCGSPPSPGDTSMACRLFPCPALGGFWGCRDLKPHDLYMLPERGTLFNALQFFCGPVLGGAMAPGVSCQLLWLWTRATSVKGGGIMGVNRFWWPHHSLGAHGAEIQGCCASQN